MKEFKLTSDFKDLPITIYYYPALKDVKGTIFLMKGLYGKHNKDGDS